MMGLNKTRRRNKGGSGLFPISIQSMRDSNVKVFILMKIQAELLLAYGKVASINTSRIEARIRIYRLLMKGSVYCYLLSNSS